MNFTTVTEGSVIVLVLDGRFDAYDAPRLSTWLDDHIRPDQAQLVADLSQVTFIDSTALATLIKGMKRTRNYSGDLHICGLAAPVRIIFELTRLDKAFRIFELRSEAVGAFHA
jgi:anti-sigma B factor antagonist